MAEQIEKADAPPPDGSTEMKTCCTLMRWSRLFHTTSSGLFFSKASMSSAGVELGAAVRRDAQRLAKQHGGVLAEDSANHLDLLARNPARHLGQLVRALLGVLRAKTVVAHQRDRDALEDLLPRLVAKLDQLGVVVAAVEQRADAQKHRRLHAQKRHDHLIDQALVAVRCFLQNHHFAGDALQRLSRTAHGRGSQSAEVVRAR